MPELPDEPTAEQVECRIELAELVQDADFRTSVRRMAEYQAAERADGDRTVHHELANYVRDRVAAATAAGIQPASAHAAPLVAELVARYADTFAATDSNAYRAQLLTRLQVANDPRVERYWQLISTINGWPTTPPLAPSTNGSSRHFDTIPNPDQYGIVPPEPYLQLARPLGIGTTGRRLDPFTVTVGSARSAA